MTKQYTLASLGWRAFFQQQLSIDEVERARPARVLTVQRSGITVGDTQGERHIALASKWFSVPAEQRPAIGDWVLLTEQGDTVVRVLDRCSVFTRVTAGVKADLQVIAANVDTLFVVTSCNEEFNASRLERYLSLAMEARVEPVVILTKADLCDSVDAYVGAVRALHKNLAIECINALDPAAIDGVRAWCLPGQTIALIGSSGVGKSTLLNSLAGERKQVTGGIRESDSSGRHTTSHRSLHLLPNGALLLDSPGMRELKMVDAEQGVTEMFADVGDLALQCRFTDCGHADEPGCAVQAAIASGALDERRLHNYRKLLREQARHTDSIAVQRHRNRQFAKHVKRVVAEKDKRR
ncbi:MAG TPA: ribosome small subunit-dependent GTPase A [Pseudomonadales bacterium]|jgi:ribosome biogenesis GTPase|nr:ribosome small subunit-dependent GTPase A [Pseudomonadales bacterium]